MLRRDAVDTSMSPSVSVVVVTRDRPRDLEVCLRSVLAQGFREFQLVVVDQSTQPTSADLVARMAATDPRLRYVHDTGKGAARARNLGTAATVADIVVFTDDDCEAQPGWLESIVESVCEDSSVGMAFGSVIPGPHDPRQGFIVGFRPTRRSRLKGRLSKLHDAGISANVGIRRSALQATGGFDEMLGPGSYFPCAEDFDLTYRVLSHGFSLLHLPEASVVHHGLRDWDSGSGLVYRTYVAIGAAYMKHIRLGDAVGIVLLVQEVFLALANIMRHVVRRRGPFGFGRLRGLLQGVWRSYELAVEPGRATYRTPLRASRLASEALHQG